MKSIFQTWTLILSSKQSSSGTSGDSNFFEETGEPKAYFIQTTMQYMF